MESVFWFGIYYIVDTDATFRFFQIPNFEILISQKLIENCHIKTISTLPLLCVDLVTIKFRSIPSRIPGDIALCTYVSKKHVFTTNI